MNNSIMKRRPPIDVSSGIKCATIDCVKPKKMKNGRSHGQFCSSCQLMRKQAIRQGVNPHSFTRGQLEQFWDVREKGVND